MKNDTGFCRSQADAEQEAPNGSAGTGRYGVHSSPLTTVISASLLTIMLLTGLVWQVRQSYIDSKYTQKQAFPIVRLRGTIIHLDEVLTMSANMAAVTGDPQWEKRYRRYEPQLEAAIRTLHKLAPETFDSTAAKQTDEANVKLVEMENRVFELVGNGRLDEAQAILAGDEYCRQKELYRDGMQQIAEDLDDYIAADLEGHRKRALITTVSALAGLLVLSLIWLWVLRNMRRYLRDRYLAEEALKESESRFRDFFANAPIGFHIFGPGQVITDINDAELEMIGYSRDEIVGKKTWADLIVPEQAGQFKKHWNDITTKGNVHNLEYTLIHKQGHRIDVLLNASSRFDKTGRFINSRGSILNITERKRSQEQIANLAKFPSEDPNPVLRITRDGTLLYANDASDLILAEWGCVEGEVVPGEWRDIISEVFENRREKRVEREYAGRILSFMIIPVVEAGYANLYCRDTTERKRAEESLKLRFNLEELLTSISTEFISLEPDEIDDGIERALESIIDAVCVDRSYIFLYSASGDTMDNTHECCRKGVPPHKNRLQNIPVEAFPWFNTKMKRFEAVIVDSVADLTEDASAEKKKWLHENIQSLLCVPMVSRGRLRGFVGLDTVLYQTRWGKETIAFMRILGTVFGNAIERKRFGQERERLLKTLAAKNEELHSLVYVASHDLKSPLVNIQGFSGELSRTCEQIREILRSPEIPADIQKRLAPLLDEDIPESIRFISAGTMKMQTLLNGLLEVSRVGSSVLQIRVLDMNEMMEHIVASMQYQITGSGTDITVDDLPACTGDPDHINQVFSNLLSNALKYLDPSRKGSIHISGRVEEGKSIYCIRDNGVGIAPEHQKKVFEIFHRLEPAGPATGDGLGLTIAQRILQRHEGRIWVESEPGKGSSFFVSLPTA